MHKLLGAIRPELMAIRAAAALTRSGTVLLVEHLHTIGVRCDILVGKLGCAEVIFTASP
jgi:hypothetical protein